MQCVDDGAVTCRCLDMPACIVVVLQVLMSLHAGERLMPDGYKCVDLVDHWWKVYADGQEKQSPTFCRKKWASMAADDDDGGKAQRIVAHGSCHSVSTMSSTYLLTRAKIIAQNGKATTKAIMGDYVRFPLESEVSDSRKIERLQLLHQDYRSRVKKACPTPFVCVFHQVMQ